MPSSTYSGDADDYEVTAESSRISTQPAPYPVWAWGLLLPLLLLVYHLAVNGLDASHSQPARPPTTETDSMLDPKTFPRPPLLERVAKHLQVKWPDAMGGTVIADTRNAYWVLETYHPPTYYIPPGDIKVPLEQTRYSSYCEWKGAASYFAIQDPSTGQNVANRAWTYRSPTSQFKDIKDHVSFYTGPWECFVDGEQVEPQPGDFYGGWMTKDILRESVKGAPGTRHW